MKYNLTFYKDWLETLYFIIVSSDDKQYCSFYVDSATDATSLLEILKLNLNKTYPQHSIEKNIVKYSIVKQDEYISSYLNLTLDEVHAIILMYMETL